MFSYPSGTYAKGGDFHAAVFPRRGVWNDLHTGVLPHRPCAHRRRVNAQIGKRQTAPTPSLDMHKSRPDSISGLIVPSAHLAASNCLLAFLLVSLCLGNFSSEETSARANNTSEKKKVRPIFPHTDTHTHELDITVLICIRFIIRYSGKYVRFVRAVEYDFEGELVLDMFVLFKSTFQARHSPQKSFINLFNQFYWLKFSILFNSTKVYNIDSYNIIRYMHNEANIGIKLKSKYLPSYLIFGKIDYLFYPFILVLSSLAYSLN